MLIGKQGEQCQRHADDVSLMKWAQERRGSEEVVTPNRDNYF